MGLLVPMSSPDITAAEIEAVVHVLQSSHLSIGPRIAEFEEHFAAYIGVRYAIGVSSGTAGLHLCVVVAGVGEGDLAITTPFSFIASANVILYERAIPVFVDIDPQTLNIDPVLVAEAVHDLSRGTSSARRWLPPFLREGPFVPRKPRAVIPVHIFGQPADMDPILELACKYDLAIVEDACEAIGAEYKGRLVGAEYAIPNTQRATVFAFYPNKQITTGEGGMIVTDNDEWAALFRSLRNQGRDVHDAWLDHSRLGYNYRMDEMSAALGLTQLSRIEELLTKREQVAKWYNERLKGMEGVQVPYIAPTTTRMSWFVYVIRLAPEIKRDEVMIELEKRGIPSRPYFPCIHLQPFYRQKFGYREGDFPIAEKVSRSSLALPFHGNMKESDVDLVCEALQDVLKRRR